MTSQTKTSSEPTAGRAMKIYFCDICNESIPLKDINTNRITIEEGKIFCQKCAPKKPRDRERTSAAVQLALVALAVGLVGAAAYGWKTIEDLRADGAARAEEVRVLTGELAEARSGIDRSAKVAGGLEGRMQKLEDDQRTAHAEMRLKIDTIDQRETTRDADARRVAEEGVGRVRADLVPRLAAVEEKIHGAQVSLSGVEATQAALTSKLAFLENLVTSSRPAAPAAAAPPPGEAAPDPAAAAASAEERAVDELIAKLKDKDSATRYTALIALQHKTGDKVVAAVEGVLADPEDYMRQTAIKVLRKIGSKPSIPRIIESLRDNDYFVRATAIGALRELAGVDGFGFDPDGPGSEREARVKQWEEWWGKNKERVLAAR